MSGGRGGCKKLKSRISISRNYNIGGTAAPANFTIACYRSTNPTFGDADDLLLGTETIGSAADKTVGSHPGKSPNLRIKKHGTYYLFARIDNGNTIAESDETNNEDQAPRTVHVIKTQSP